MSDRPAAYFTLVNKLLLFAPITHAHKTYSSLVQRFKHFNQFNGATKTIIAGFLIILEINAGTSKIP